MKEIKFFTIGILVAILIFPAVSADIIVSTQTNIYFIQNGTPYNGIIEFNVTGYGYSYSSGSYVEKSSGTYIPTDVFSFSAKYKNYGDKIYEPYYTNYRKIDYYEIKGKTSDGKTFLIENVSKVPTECGNLNSYNESLTDEKEIHISRICNFTINLDDAR